MVGSHYGLWGPVYFRLTYASKLITAGAVAMHVANGRLPHACLYAACAEVWVAMITMACLACGTAPSSPHTPNTVTYHEQSRYCRFMIGHSLGRMYISYFLTTFPFI